MTYDEKSYDLAALFLGDEPALNSEAARHRLACTIQTAIEDWFEMEAADRAEADANNGQFGAGA